MTNKHIELDVAIIRLIIIFLLIVYHAFSPYTGVWPSPSGYLPVNAYWWCGKAAYSFMLEGFVFISGYLFFLQLYRNKYKSFVTLVINKINRLIIPSVVFSTLYYFMFIFDKNTFVWYKSLYLIINGIGHMWFLPMLFWCFLFGYILNKIKCSKLYLLIMLFFLTFISIFPLPFQINQACYYMFFFYLGGLCESNKKRIKRHITKKVLLLSVILYVVSFVGLTWFNEQLGDISKIWFRLSSITSSVFGIIMLYVSVNQYLTYHKISHLNIIISINSLCFGIYLYHQFLLVYMYYCTSVPSVTGPYILPFVGLLFAAFGSAFLTYYTRKSAIGRYLIG